MKMTKKALDLLIAARDRLAGRGVWVKDEYEGEHTTPGGKEVHTFCMLGALGYEYDEDAMSADRRNRSRTQQIAVQAITAELPDAEPDYFGDIPEPSIVGFNDAPGTLKRDVLGVFDAAIAKAQGETA